MKREGEKEAFVKKWMKEFVRVFSAKNNTVTMLHPPYLPDMAPCDSFLFPKIKKTLKSPHFISIDDIIAISAKGYLKNRV